jgi:hypothetical protein
MNFDWASLVATQLTALAAALWAVWKWRQEREADRRAEQDRLASLHLTPFLFACEELQSRLYNLLCKGALGPLRARKDYPYPEETVYFVAQYFAYEGLLLRHTRYGIRPDVLELIQRIRGEFSHAGTAADVDPWCIFRPRQRALGQLALAARDDADGPVTDVIPLLDFDKALKDEAGALFLDGALDSLRRAQRVAELPPRTRSRLAAVQSHLVDLLALLEQEVKHLTGEADFSLQEGTRFKATQHCAGRVAGDRGR